MVKKYISFIWPETHRSTSKILFIPHLTACQNMVIYLHWQWIRSFIAPFELMQKCVCLFIGSSLSRCAWMLTVVLILGNKHGVACTIDWHWRNAMCYTKHLQIQSERGCQTHSTDGNSMPHRKGNQFFFKQILADQCWHCFLFDNVLIVPSLQANGKELNSLDSIYRKIFDIKIKNICV